MSAGVGLSIRAGRNTVFVEGRYTRGLTDLSKEDEDLEVKNRGVQVLAGVTFPFGRR